MGRRQLLLESKRQWRQLTAAISAISISRGKATLLTGACCGDADAAAAAAQHRDGLQQRRAGAAGRKQRRGGRARAAAALAGTIDAARGGLALCSVESWH